MSRKRICIINFADYKDWRMARELDHIRADYDVTIVGLKEIFEPGEGIEWKFIESKTTPISKLWDRAMMLFGKVLPSAYDTWFWRRKRYGDALTLALETHADVYQANDWASLAVAVEAAQRTHAKVVYDAHEYWSLETENQPLWKMFFSPLIKHIEDRYIPKLDALVSVSPPIVERYGQEYRIQPTLIMNAPKLTAIPPFKPTNREHIRIINHGSAVRDRHIERMIEALAFADARFTLDFIFLPIHQDYIEELKALAAQLVPGRVTFHPPLPASEVIARVAEYDIGMFIIKPVSYNYHNALPNRFFDFIAAGLAVCVGPSPAMKAIVDQFGIGLVTPTFEAVDIGAALNRLTTDDIDRMKHASREAVQHFNAETENHKWVTLYHDLFADHA